MKTYLAAIDFSAISSAVMECAARLATSAGARLVILHVVELPPLREPGSDVVVHSATMDAPDLERIKERLEEIAEPLRGKGLRVETRVAVGIPADEILSAAKSEATSLLIMGSRGHGVVVQLFAGSVVTAILHKAEIPVTVVPVHGHREHQCT